MDRFVLVAERKKRRESCNFCLKCHPLKVLELLGTLKFCVMTPLACICRPINDCVFVCLLIVFLF